MNTDELRALLSESLMADVELDVDRGVHRLRDDLRRLRDDPMEAQRVDEFVQVVEDADDVYRIGRLASGQGDLGIAECYLRQLAEIGHYEAAFWLAAVLDARSTHLRKAGDDDADRLATEARMWLDEARRAGVFDIETESLGDPFDVTHDEGGCRDDQAPPPQVVGREEVLARLEAAWWAALTGDQRTVHLVGGAGMGKTVLLAELARRLEGQGGLVLYGRWEQGSPMPYQAVRDALTAYARSAPTSSLEADLEGWQDEIARLLPDIGVRLGGSCPPLQTDPEVERLRLFSAVETWLRRTAHRHPVVLMLDDLHWADEASRQLLDHLRRRRGTGPLLVVVAARRRDEHDPDDAHGVERIELTGIDAAAVGRLVEEALGEQDSGIARSLARKTGGNPLVVRELLHRVASTPDPRGALGPVLAGLPSRLHDVIGWRMGRLSPHATDALTAAALVGMSFDLDLLAEVTDRGPEPLRTLADAAVDAGLLRASSADTYELTHDTIRQFLLSELPPRDAIRLHRRIATALENRSAPAIEIAHHHLSGADAHTAFDAVRWARRAAHDARRETAFEAAVALLGRAVEVHERLGGIAPAVGPCADDGGGRGDSDAGESHGELACHLQLELAEAHDRAGDFAARDQHYRTAIDLARRLDRVDLLSEGALGFGGRLPAATPPNPEARALLEEALARTSQENRRERALVLARLARIRYFDTPYERRRELADAAVATARRLGIPPVLGRVLADRCLALDGPNDVEEQVATGREIVEISHQTGDRELLLHGKRVYALALFHVGHHAEAQEQADTFVKLAHEDRHPDHLRIAQMWEILWAALEGRYEAALEYATELRHQLEEARHQQAKTIFLAQTFPVSWLRGDAARSRQVNDAIQSAGFATGISWAIDLWLDLATGDRQRARARLADESDPRSFIAGIRHDVMWWPTVIPLALTAVECRDRSWAAALYEALAPHQGCNSTFGMAAFTGAVDHHLGTLALTLGRVEQGIDHLDAGLERHEDLGAGPFVALSARWLARALAQRGRAGDQQRITTLQARSVELIERLGLQGLPRFDESPA